MDASYAGLVHCHFVDSVKRNDDWIFDFGASDHMTGNIDMLCNMFECKENPMIDLPTGETSRISNTGDVVLKNNMKLINVLYIYSFFQS